MVKSFSDLSEKERDKVARDRIRKILGRRRLQKGDTETMAACVALLGRNQRNGDRFSQSLLDVAESVVTGLCVRCGAEPPGIGEPEPLPEGVEQDCLVCTAVRDVGLVAGDDEGGWTERDLSRLEKNSHLAEIDVGLLARIMERGVDDVRVKCRELGYLA